MKKGGAKLLTFLLFVVFITSLYVSFFHLSFSDISNPTNTLITGEATVATTSPAMIGRILDDPDLCALYAHAFLPDGTQDTTGVAFSLDKEASYIGKKDEIIGFKTKQNVIFGSKVVAGFTMGNGIALKNHVYISAVQNINIDKLQPYLLIFDSGLTTDPTEIPFAHFTKGSSGAVAVSPDGKNIYATNYGSTDFVVVNLKKGKITHVDLAKLGVEEGISDLEVSNDNTLLYLLNARRGMLYVLKIKEFPFTLINSRIFEFGTINQPMFVQLEKAADDSLYTVYNEGKQSTTVNWIVQFNTAGNAIKKITLPASPPGTFVSPFAILDQHRLVLGDGRIYALTAQKVTATFPVANNQQVLDVVALPGSSSVLHLTMRDARVVEGGALLTFDGGFSDFMRDPFVIKPGTTHTLHLCARKDAGLEYRVLLSYGKSKTDPGSFVLQDGRVVPLAKDTLFEKSLKTKEFHGTLDLTGQSPDISFTAPSGIKEPLSVWISFVTLAQDGKTPVTISYVPTHLLIQP